MLNNKQDLIREHSLQALMGGGARNFLVVNVPPIGCSTQSREAYANALGNANGDISTRLDEHNCLRPLNDVIDLHNTQLRDLLQALRNKHQDGLFVYVDYNGVIRSMLSSRFTSILGRCLFIHVDRVDFLFHTSKSEPCLASLVV